MNRTVAYTALEPYPVDPRTAAQLSYGADRLFMALHEAPVERSGANYRAIPHPKGRNFLAGLRI